MPTRNTEEEKKQRREQQKRQEKRAGVLMAIRQVQAVPVKLRTVQQSALLVKAFEAGLIEDCGYHP